MTHCVQYAVKCVLYRTELWSFICGDFLKVKSVYDHNPIDSLEILKNGIIAACEEIRNTSEIFEHFRQPSKLRCGICIVVEGNHFQQLNKF